MRRSLTEFQAIQAKFSPQPGGTSPAGALHNRAILMHPTRELAVALGVLCASPVAADYRITRDFGGLLEEYKAKYAKLRERGDRVIIDGICNSACTIVLGIVPPNRICVTPKASLGFHQAYFDKSWTLGIRVTSYSGTNELISYYPQPVRDWINHHGGLSAEMKHVTNGPDLWAMVDPCPDEF